MELFEVKNSGCPDEDFLKDYDFAIAHIAETAKKHGGEIRWIRTFPYGTALEHFSFFYGGQAYFVLLQPRSFVAPAGSGDIFERSDLPGLKMIAEGYRGHACLFLFDVDENGKPCLAFPERSEWGLVDVEKQAFIDPDELSSDIPVSVTDWELLDFALQVVRDELTEAGHEVGSWLCVPGTYPSLWFRDKDTHALEWVVAKAFRTHDFDQSFPEEAKEAARRLFARGFGGYYFGAGFLPADGGRELLRGRAARVATTGIVAVSPEELEPAGADLLASLGGRRRGHGKHGPAEGRTPGARLFQGIRRGTPGSRRVVRGRS